MPIVNGLKKGDKFSTARPRRQFYISEQMVSDGGHFVTHYEALPAD
jgi:hypothetical protein